MKEWSISNVISHAVKTTNTVSLTHLTKIGMGFLNCMNRLTCDIASFRTKYVRYSCPVTQIYKILHLECDDAGPWYMDDHWTFVTPSLPTTRLKCFRSKRNICNSWIVKSTDGLNRWISLRNWKRKRIHLICHQIC